MKWLKSRDMLAVSLLVVLWLMFFWRLFTPIEADQVSFKQGDFSGQFVAFGAYQYARFTQGEVPLWNPYNNGGLPFIADTQAAVFYPPRLLTIAMARLLGGWSYMALQMEAVFHVLAYSLLVYVFVRRLTLGNPGSTYGAFIGAVIAAYGGYISGYPPLQLAILEAAFWLPLAATAILEATRTARLEWRWLLMAGFALGLSWMAGHPQTSWFMTYLLVAWLGYRAYQRRYSWLAFIGGTAWIGITTIGITAVTLLPGIEYLLLTTRADLGFDGKSNGFPFQDLAQFLFPGTVSLFSPLYVGTPALVLAYIAVRDRLPNSFFWVMAALIGLLHSFGANSAFYPTLYNLVPGLRFFRGQERAALIVAFSLAVLAGMGASQLTLGATTNKRDSVRRVLLGLIFLIGSVALVSFVGWQGTLQENFRRIEGIAIFSLIIAAVLYGLMMWQLKTPNRIPATLIATLIIFELFTVNMFGDGTYEPVPTSRQLSLTPPPLVQTVLDDDPAQPYRVDGYRGLQANYGSLYGVMDMRGISPLFLTSTQRLIYRDYINNPLAWELFAVRYIFSERESLSSVETHIITTGADLMGTVFVHEIIDPRPFAHLVYHADIVNSDEFAYALLDDPRYQPRNSIILLGEPGIALPAAAPANGSTTVTDFAPEAFTIAVDTPENAILSLAQVDYPGWSATLDGEPVPVLRAYGALTAIAVPAGEHTIYLQYDPITYRVGAIMSLVTWSLQIILAVLSMYRAISKKIQER